MLIEIQRAVCQSQLDPDTRHMVMVMMLLADNDTGRGFSKQETIAASMGRSVRHVGNLLRALEANADSPITVTRRHRGRVDGGGRSSDEYVLALRPPRQSGTPASSQTAPRADSPPLQSAPDAFSVTPAPPGQTARHAGQTAQCADDLLFVGSLSANTPASNKPKRVRKTRVKVVPAVPCAHDLKIHYVAEFQRLRGATPAFGKAWGRAMMAFGELVQAHGIDAARGIVSRALIPDAYRSRIQPWEISADSNKYLGAQPRKGNAPLVQRGGTVRDSSPSWDDQPEPSRKLAAVR